MDFKYNILFAQNNINAGSDQKISNGLPTYEEVMELQSSTHTGRSLILNTITEKKKSSVVVNEINESCEKFRKQLSGIDLNLCIQENNKIINQREKEISDSIYILEDKLKTIRSSMNCFYENEPDISKFLLLHEENLKSGLFSKLNDTIQYFIQENRRVLLGENYTRTISIEEFFGACFDILNCGKRLAELKTLFDYLDPETKCKEIRIKYELSDGGILTMVNHEDFLTKNTVLKTLPSKFKKEKIIDMIIVKKVRKYATRYNLEKIKCIYTAAIKLDMSRMEKKFNLYCGAFVTKRLDDIKNDINLFKDNPAIRYEDILRDMFGNFFDEKFINYSRSGGSLTSCGKLSKITKEFKEMQENAETLNPKKKMLRPRYKNVNCLDEYTIGENLKMKDVQNDRSLYNALLDIVGIIESKVFELETLVTMPDNLIVIGIIVQIKKICQGFETEVVESENLSKIKEFFQQLCKNQNDTQYHVFKKYLGQIETFLLSDSTKKESWQILYDSLQKIKDCVKVKEQEIIELSQELADLKDRKANLLETNQEYVRNIITISNFLQSKVSKIIEKINKFHAPKLSFTEKFFKDEKQYRDEKIKQIKELINECTEEIKWLLSVHHTEAFKGFIDLLQSFVDNLEAKSQELGMSVESNELAQIEKIK